MKNLKKLTTILLIFMFAAYAAIGCSSPAAEETTVEAGRKENSESGSDWPESITIVQMPNENNPDIGTIHAGFSEALSEYLGIEVKETEGADYSVGIEAMANEQIDVMLASPMSYYHAKERAAAELLVSTPMAAEYRSGIITRADNDEINELEDLEGHSFAFADQASSSGYMYPKAMLVNELDLDTDLLENSGYFFESVAFSGAHDASITGVVMGDYEAAAVATMVVSQMAEAGVINEDDIKIIAETDVIPNPAYVVRGGLPEDLKAKIKEFYLQFDDSAYFEEVHGDSGIRFIEVTEDDYKIIYETLEALNIEGEVD